MVGGQAVEVSAVDGAAIKEALLTYLSASTNDARSELIVWTRAATVGFDPGGRLRIGQWVLEGGQSGPTLRLRERPRGGSMRGHTVTLARDPRTSWRVVNLGSEHLYMRS